MDSEFWGCVIPAGRAVRVEVATDEEYVHVSQAALGADARAGIARGAAGRERTNACAKARVLYTVALLTT